MSQPASLSIGPIVGALLIAMLGCFTYKEADLSQCVRKLNMQWRSSLVTRRCKRAPHFATVNSHTGVTNIQTRRSMPMDLQRCRHPNSYITCGVGHRGIRLVKRQQTSAQPTVLQQNTTPSAQSSKDGCSHITHRRPRQQGSSGAPHLK